MGPTNNQPDQEPIPTEVPQVPPTEPEAPPIATPSNVPESIPVEQPTIVEPTPTVPAESNLPSDMTGVTPVAEPVIPKKKSKKGLIITLIAVGVVVLGLIIGGLVYALVYNKPENVVLDAFTNALAAKSGESSGTFTFKSNDTGFSVDFSGATNESNQLAGNATMKISDSGKDVTLKGAVAATDEKFFIKVDNVKQTLKDFYGSEASDVIDEYFGSLLNKIDSKWVVFTKTELEDFSNDDNASSKEAVCMQEEIQKLRTDSTVRKEVVDVYKKNAFVNIESKGSDSNGNRYNLTLSKDKTKAFGKAIVETKFFKALDDCTSEDLKKELSADSNSSSTSEVKEESTSLEVWVDSWSHTLKKVSFNVAMTANDSSKGTMQLDLYTKFNTKPAVTIPEADTTLDDIRSEVEDIQKMFIPSTTTSSATYDYYY